MNLKQLLIPLVMTGALGAYQNPAMSQAQITSSGRPDVVAKNEDRKNLEQEVVGYSDKITLENIAKYETRLARQKSTLNTLDPNTTEYKTLHADVRTLETAIVKTYVNSIDIGWIRSQIVKDNSDVSAIQTKYKTVGLKLASYDPNLVETSKRKDLAYFFDTLVGFTDAASNPDYTRIMLSFGSRLDPTNPNIWYGLAIAEFSSGDYGKAIANFQKVVQNAGPNHADISAKSQLSITRLQKLISAKSGSGER